MTISKYLQGLQGRCVGKGVSTAPVPSPSLWSVVEKVASPDHTWDSATTISPLCATQHLTECQASQVMRWYLSHFHFCLCPNQDGQQQLQLFLVMKGLPGSLECEAAGCQPWPLGLCQVCMNSLGKGEAKEISEVEMRSLHMGKNQNREGLTRASE